MKTGAKWKVFIPSDLAYQERGNNSIGPNETLTFEIELLGITQKPQAPESFDSNASDSNSSSGTAPLVIPEAEGNTTAAEPATEANASASAAESNGSE